MSYDLIKNFPAVFYNQKSEKIPETFVDSSSPNPIILNLFGESIEITGGFMEPSGHGNKDTPSYAIFDKDPTKIVKVKPGPYNIGIDYVLPQSNQATQSWYSGVVEYARWEGGYGNRVLIKTDVTYNFGGKEYQVYTGYAHLDSMDVKKGQKVKQGQRIGEMGGTGKNPPYDEHVDMQTYVKIDGRIVNISPNLLQQQLIDKAVKQVGEIGLGIIEVSLESKLNIPIGTLEKIWEVWKGSQLKASNPAAYAKDAENEFNDAASSLPPRCPLVLDLDGDGIELTAVTTTNTYFDLDGDGFRELTGWVKGDDGLLVFDKNNDKYINDISELFGNGTTGGFAVLKGIDSNNDGIINSADTNFSKLQVWKDLDSDGRSDVNELLTLGQLNIASINTNSTAVNISQDGNRINATSTYTLANGTQREIVNAWFTVDQLDSRYDFRSTFNQPVNLTPEIIKLPNLRGYGNLPDLQIAMAKDNQLVALVQSFTDKVGQQDITGASNLIRGIFYRWAGVEGVAIDSRGYGNAQELGFLEKFIGRSWFDINSNPNIDFYHVDRLTSAFNRIFVASEQRLFAQAVSGMGVDFDVITDRLTYAGDTSEALAELDAILAKNAVNPSPQLEAQAMTLTWFLSQPREAYANVWQTGTVRGDKVEDNSTENRRLFGFFGNDNLVGQYGNDILLGGSGDDYLEDTKGDDYLDGGTETIISMLVTIAMVQVLMLTLVMIP